MLVTTCSISGAKVVGCHICVDRLTTLVAQATNTQYHGGYIHPMLIVISVALAFPSPCAKYMDQLSNSDVHVVLDMQMESLESEICGISGTKAWHHALISARVPF